LTIATTIIFLLTTNWFTFHFFAGLLNVGFSIGLLHSAGHMSIHKRFNSILYKIGVITSGLIPLDAWRLNHNYFHHIYTGAELDADRDNYQTHLQTHPLSKYPKHKYSTIKKCAYIFALFIFPGQWFGLIRQHYKWIVLGSGIRGFIGILNKSKYMDVISILTIMLFGSYILTKPVSCFISFFIGMNIAFTCIVLPNHATNDTYNSIQTNTNCWATKQITESANYSMDNYAITHIFGGINFQIEHHLFPKLPPHLLVEIQPIVMKFCKENNIKYNSFSNIRFGIISGIQNIFIHN
jgi:linoleoyl-CoA desaturase